MFILFHGCRSSAPVIHVYTWPPGRPNSSVRISGHEGSRDRSRACRHKSSREPLHVHSRRRPHPPLTEQRHLKLRRLAEDPDLPEVIGLSFNGEDQLKAFRKELQAIFPIGHITEEDFWRLLGDGNVPRTFLVRDRVVQEVWDIEIPDEDTIKSIVAVQGEPV